MKLTDALKKYASEKLSVKADASDDVFKKAIGEAVTSGSLDAKAFEELTREKAQAAGLAGMKSMLVETLKETLPGMVKETVIGMGLTPKTDPKGTGATELTDDQKKKLGGGVSAADVLTQGANGAVRVEVKKASDRYSDKRYVGKHVKTGQEVLYNGRPVEHPSDRDLAKMGAFIKMKAIPTARQKGLNPPPLTPHERELIVEIFDDDNEEAFVGATSKDAANWYKDDKGFDGVTGHKACEIMFGKAFNDFAPEMVKSQTFLGDESGGSGGQGLVPIFYDMAVVIFPLLHSEIFPYVDIEDVARGSRMVLGSLGNPTMTWGTTEGTSLTMFDTTALAAEIDTSIYVVQCSFELGLDFLSDSPLRVGELVQKNMGQSYLKEADNVISTGSGSSRPQGFSNASGVNTVNPINPGGNLLVDDASNLIFGLAKAYRTKADANRFLMNDADYALFRNIPVSASDQRRVFGMQEGYQDYRLFDFPVSVNQSITQGTIMFVAPKKFRLYRRKGWDVRTEAGGETLANKNCLLVIGRSRIGGKVIDAAGVAKMTGAA